MSDNALARLAACGIELLGQDDPVLFKLLEREYERQMNVLAMVAASSLAHPSVLACAGSFTSNVTTEGYPGARFHAGCQVVDEIERLAVERVKAAFRAEYANVQPHSGTSANECVIFSLLKPGDTILGLGLNAGGHLTHGAKASVVGQYFHAVGYGLNQEGFIDYDEVARLAKSQRPKLIISGASAYPRVIDFQRFRQIADGVGAFLLADISHIAGLVVAGVHPSPIDHAHFTTSSTYKQLYGPRGGLILIGKDAHTLAPDGKRTLSELVQSAVFPFFQGTPNLAAIAAKARALAMVDTPEFRTLAQRIVANAKALAEGLLARGYSVLTRGSDTHIVLIDVGVRGLTGVVCERALEECNIIVNRNRIPGDKRDPFITSGIRLGTNSLALRGMAPREMERCADLLDSVLSAIAVSDESTYELNGPHREFVRDQVKQLCRSFKVPYYPAGFTGDGSQAYGLGDVMKTAPLTS